MKLRSWSWLLLLVAGGAPGHAAAAPVANPIPSQASFPKPSRAQTTRVLFVGNSLTYVNNLPALLGAVSDAQAGGPRIEADLIAAPGGTIAERWADGVVQAQLGGGKWQALVLQEQGGLLACLAQPEQRSAPGCAASLSAHRKFAELAHTHGMRVIVLGTWGPDSIWQGKLSRGLRQVAKSANAEPVDMGPLLRDYARSHPQVPMTSDSVLHPSMDASLLMALRLYKALTGSMPTALPVSLQSAELLPRAQISPMGLLSAQLPAAAKQPATVFEAARLQPLLEAVAADGNGAKP